MYPFKGFTTPGKRTPKVISFTLWLMLKLSFPNAIRSCTCMFACWNDLPGAKWKLPATLFTSKDPNTWHPSPSCSLIFCIKPSLLHCKCCTRNQLRIRSTKENKSFTSIKNSYHIVDVKHETTLISIWGPPLTLISAQDWQVDCLQMQTLEVQEAHSGHQDVIRRGLILLIRFRSTCQKVPYLKLAQALYGLFQLEHTYM